MIDPEYIRDFKKSVVALMELEEMKPNAGFVGLVANNFEYYAKRWLELEKKRMR